MRRFLLFSAIQVCELLYEFQRGNVSMCILLSVVVGCLSHGIVFFPPCRVCSSLYVLYIQMTCVKCSFLTKALRRLHCCSAEYHVYIYMSYLSSHRAVSKLRLCSCVSLFSLADDRPLLTWIKIIKYLYSFQCNFFSWILLSTVLFINLFVRYLL